jgi:hypothetical protein
MEDRLVQIIKEKHILTWEDNGNTGVAAGELKLVFQHGDEIVILSELNESSMDDSVEHYMESYEKDDYYRQHGRFVPKEDYFKFMAGMKNIYGSGVHSTFMDVITVLADGGAVVDKDICRELEIINDAIGRILQRNKEKTNGL